MESVWTFIETTLKEDVALQALCPISYSNNKMVQRGFYTLPNRFDSMVTYLGITSVPDAPIERHSYRLTAWSAADTNDPELLCSRVLSRVVDIFSGKSFIEEDFIVINTETNGRDEGATFEEDKAAWRMDLMLTFVLVKR